MEKRDNNLLPPQPPEIGNPPYSFHLHHEHQQQQPHHQQQQAQPLMNDEASSEENGGAVNFMTNINVLQEQQQQQDQFCSSFYPNNSLDDRFSFADVMRFADGPTLGLKQGKTVIEHERRLDPSSYFLKFPVLRENILDDHETLMGSFAEGMDLECDKRGKNFIEGHEGKGRGGFENPSSSVPHHFLGENLEKNSEVKNKRKRPRSVKSNEEVESQRMTHIAVERNRRKQMNEHLRVLRSLMPGSYVQRGDQASIIGGAIEFVRELEQLLQCLESQKRRRLFGENESQTHIGESSSSLPLIQATDQTPFFPPLEGGLEPDTAESKSCLADVEVKVMGCDAMIKILSTRRMGQLIKTIAAIEDLQLNIVHTNVTTIDQTVLYSFNVKVACESRVTADDIAGSVQQILSYIHANSGI